MQKSIVGASRSQPAPDSNHPFGPLAKVAISQFGPDSSVLRLLTEYHQRFLTLASLVNRLGIPYQMAIPKVLEHPPHEFVGRLEAQLRILFQHPFILDVLSRGNPLDVGDLMVAAGFQTFDPTVTVLMNRILLGSHFFQETIRSGLTNAIQQGQTLGVEIEFSPKPGMTRDDAYRALQSRLTAAGYQVDLLRWEDIRRKDGTAEGRNFNFGPKPGIYPAIFGHFDYNGVTIDTQLLEGTGAIMHTVTRGPDDSERLRAKAENLAGAMEELGERVAEALNLGSVESVKELMAKGSDNYRETRIYMLKDDTGDIAKVEVALLPDGKARLAGNNCLLHDETGQLVGTLDIAVTGTTPPEQFAEVDAWLHKHVKNSGRGFAQKVDEFGALNIQGIEGLFRIVVEAHPDLELITPVLTAEQGEVLQWLIEGLRQGGFEGTRAANVVGIHVHAGLPLTFTNAQGKEVPTIAPAVNIMRAFGLDAKDIISSVPTHENRVGFLHTVRPELIDLFSEAGYVTDPTDPMQILRVCADIVRLTRTKYTALNLDNYISFLLGAIILGNPDEGIEPLLKIGKETDTIYRTSYTSPRFGKQDYVFQVVETSDGVNIRLLTLLPDTRPLGPDGEAVEYVEMIRIKRTAWKKTVEVRLFDTNLDDRRLANMDMQFVGAWVAKFARAHLIPQESMRAMQEAVVKAPVPPLPAAPAVGEAGYATIAGLLNIATLGGAAAAESLLKALTAYDTLATAAATRMLQGGLNFLAADAVSDAVLGNWNRLRNLSLTQAAKDYAFLTVGGEAGRATSSAALKALPLPAAVKALTTRVSSLFGAVTAQQYGNTGTVAVEKLPASVASIMAASALVQGSVAAAGQAESLSHLARVLRLARIGGGATGLGTLVTTVAEFTLFKTFGKWMEEMDESAHLATLTDSVGSLLASAAAIPAALAEHRPVNPGIIAAIQGQLDQVIAVLDKGLSLEERRVWAAYQQGAGDLREWRTAKMAAPLNGSHSRAEIEAQYQQRLADITHTRDTTLVPLATDTTRASRLPVDPADDWTAFVDAVDEGRMKADVDMDGNPTRSDPAPLRYQALLDRNPHVLVAQLKQFRADYQAAVKRYQDIPPATPSFFQFLANVH